MRKILMIFCLSILVTMSYAQTINTFPYFTGFEGIEGNLHTNYPEGWTSEDLNTNTSGNQTWEIIKNSANNLNARTDSTAIHMLSNMSQVNNDWLYTPGIEMVEGKTYSLSFWYNTFDFGGTSEKLKIHIGNDAVSTAMSVDALWDNILTNTSYLQATIHYTPASGGVYYFGFHCYSDDFQYILLIDDITISESSSTELENNTISEYSFYPNPCNSNLHLSIQNEGFQNVIINVFDSNGKILFSDLFNGNSYDLNTSNYPVGVYTILFYTDGTQINSQRIIVEH